MKERGPRPDRVPTACQRVPSVIWRSAAGIMAASVILAVVNALVDVVIDGLRCSIRQRLDRSPTFGQAALPRGVERRPYQREEGLVSWCGSGKRSGWTSLIAAFVVRRTREGNTEAGRACPLLTCPRRPVGIESPPVRRTLSAKLKPSDNSLSIGLSREKRGNFCERTSHDARPRKGRAESVPL